MSRPALPLLLALVLLAALPVAAQKIDPLTGRVVEEAPPPEPEGPALADLTEANELVRKQKFAEAEALLAGMQDEYPEDDRLLAMRGELLVALGKPADAIPLLRKVVELAPERDRVRFQLGTALASTGDPAGAIEAFGGELEVSEDPQIRARAHLNRSVLFENQHDLGNAAEELENALELDPSLNRAWGDLATLRLQSDDVDGALRALEKGSAAGYESASHFYSVGARLYKAERYAEAESAFRKVLEIDDGHARAVRSLAASLEELGRADEAIPLWKRYLELAPKAADAEQVSRKLASGGK